MFNSVCMREREVRGSGGERAGKQMRKRKRKEKEDTEEERRG